MTAIEQQVELAGEQPRALERRRRFRPFVRSNWWRHVIAILAVLFALFPVAYITSAAFNADNTLSGQTLIPREFTLDNFRTIFSGEVTTTGGTAEMPYLRWYVNTLAICTMTAALTVLFGALAAYAFARFRFKGRRFGLTSLLLIQMFPQLLLIVAIYLIVSQVGEVFPTLGLNSLTALMVVYLAGVLGVNVWLMKGFFDTIPAELDESARVDGASPAQIFWGVILPLAAPVLAVIFLLSFVFTLNEFAIARTLLDTNDKFTLSVGMYGYINQEYAERWGPFAAGVLLAAIPAALLFIFLQKFIVRGLTAGSVKG
jgi:arabinogalactan oligomer/maltooligosaccharide transport system permease protein